MEKANTAQRDRPEKKRPRSVCPTDRGLRKPVGGAADARQYERSWLLKL